jgi:integrase
MRGLRWIDIDFEGRQINVNQRSDASHRIGKLKSKAAYRSIPSPPIVLNALREWKLVCPKGDLGLVFPNGSEGWSRTPTSLTAILGRSRSLRGSPKPYKGAGEPFVPGHQPDRFVTSFRETIGPREETVFRLADDVLK